MAVSVDVEVKHMSEYDPEERQDTAITDEVDKAFKPKSVSKARKDVEPVLGPNSLLLQDVTFTVHVEVKHESELDPELQQPRDIALVASLEGCESVVGLKGLQTLDRASEGGMLVPSCANVSGERALQQIVAGCSVKLQRLRLLRCDVCQRIFQKRSRLMTHYFDMHVNEDLEESDVITGKAESDSIEKCVPELENTVHIQHTSTENLKLHTCNICDDMFAFKADMSIHKLKHSGKKPLSCEICHQLFASKTDLRIHMKCHTAEKLYRCDVCKKQFHTLHRLNWHKKIHSGIKPYSCQFCEKKFVLKVGLIRHRRTHTGEKPYACVICDRQFPYYSGLKCHQATHMSKRARAEKKFHCDYCNKIYNFRGALVLHIRLHMNSQLFSCDDCGENFEWPDSLKRHRAKHTGDLPYSCSFCDRKFPVKYHLTRHIRTHTKEKPYSCEICDKKFAMEYHVTSHLRVHSKAHQCKMCDKSFHLKSKLDRHLKCCEMVKIKPSVKPLKNKSS